ncbi:hypothetical protein [Burkholderia lata]|uniref:hypothetical protein n=1 Tax=Burkholderia lata (strain ATCC 17760 / DSM 23089 / LMG 22485 / NCIMB 9086 / R18194 / 383) TaxID=482957 RepID=UPI001453653A|nr:hypothetical protein [Burkholderia lata]VWB15426.1 hypothetical protein BLA15816_00552 [Burkholderia lata]
MAAVGAFDVRKYSESGIDHSAMRRQATHELDAAAAIASIRIGIECRVHSRSYITADWGQVLADFTRLTAVEPVVHRMCVNASAPAEAVTVRDRIDTSEGNAALQSALGR